MEILRRAIRSVLGYDSGLYRSAATFVDFWSTVSKDGVRTWRTLEEIKNGKRNSEPCSIALNDLDHSILLRPGTSDVGTIVNNVIRQEYGHFALKRNPEWMIDAGAYIGDTSAYFLSKFPGLKVVAIEPNPENYNMARLNLQPYGDRAVLLKKGLYSSEKNQWFSGADTGGSIAQSGFEVECTTIPSLLERYSIQHVDILKMDIEGAEEAVFSSKPELWLGHIGLLMIEIHGPIIESLISRVLNANGFSMKRYRSIWYCQRESK